MIFYYMWFNFFVSYKNLFLQSFKKDSLVHDICGKTVPAFTVFSESIKYFKNHFLKTLTERGSILEEKDIKFVLTVPAIWSDRSKKFMRDAADKVWILKLSVSLIIFFNQLIYQSINLPFKYHLFVLVWWVVKSYLTLWKLRSQVSMIWNSDRNISSLDSFNII